MEGRRKRRTAVLAGLAVGAALAAVAALAATTQQAEAVTASKIVFTSNPEGDHEIYRMNAADGSGKKNLTNNAAEYDEFPEWGR